MNELMRWIAEHGKDTLETTGLIVSLGLATASYRAEARERSISNLLELTAAHRDLWKELLERPELARILRADVDLQTAPVTVVEERFVHLLITHLATTHAALKSHVLPKLDGLEDDVKTFFALPIPAHAWQWSRRFQNREFVRFVNHIRR